MHKPDRWCIRPESAMRCREVTSSIHNQYTHAIITRTKQDMNNSGLGCGRGRASLKNLVRCSVPQNSGAAPDRRARQSSYAHRPDRDQLLRPPGEESDTPLVAPATRRLGQSSAVQKQSAVWRTSPQETLSRFAQGYAGMAASAPVSPAVARGAPTSRYPIPELRNNLILLYGSVLSNAGCVRPSASSEIRHRPGWDLGSCGVHEGGSPTASPVSATAL